MKQQILGTGLSGLVGSRIVELLSDSFDFQDASYDTGVDITDRGAVDDFISQSKAEWIIHLAAKADVEGCEKDKNTDIKILRYKNTENFDKNVAYDKTQWNGQNTAWTINVIGTKNIIDTAQKYGKKVLYISTDFVFDGTKDSYDEDDVPSPTNWYAATKYEGEKIVSKLPRSLIVRITFPYRAQFSVKKDFVRAILEKFQNNQSIATPTDNLFTPTFIDDVAHAIKTLIEQERCGIYHVVGNTVLGSYDAAIMIAKVFGFNPTLVHKTSASVYYANRTKRPLKLGTKNDKIRKLGIKMRTFEEGLREIKKQINRNG